MSTNHRILAVIVATAVLPLAAFSQVAEAGEKSISKLRKEVYQAEEAFYEIYNGLNDDPDYDVRCYYETATGTHTKSHVCRAVFVADAYAKHAAKNRNDLSRIAGQNSDPKLAEQTAIFEEKIATLVSTNLELQAAFQRYNEARAEFFEARESR